MKRDRHHGRHPGGARSSGFSLLELMLALSLGLVVGGAMLQGLLAEVRGSQRLGVWLHERSQMQRALTLLQQEAARATRLEFGSEAFSTPACNLTGRRVLVQIVSGADPVTYSLGPAPSSIWRGEVLMRCGPAYGLDGEPGSGASQNRVLSDGLAKDASRIEPLSGTTWRVTLQGLGRSELVLAQPGSHR